MWLQARLFVHAVVVGSDNATTTVLLDHTRARTLVERMWHYDAGKLHDKAIQMGMDPLRVIRIAAEGNPGLSYLTTKESVQALIILRLVKQPPSLAEKLLRYEIEATGCARPGCKADKGTHCSGGCKWDESGVGTEMTERHRGLVSLRKFAVHVG